MATRKAIELEIGDLGNLGGIVTVYKEIAATRITRTRTAVIKSHNFLTEINEIFEQVKSSYKREVERLAKQKKIKDVSALSFVKRNGKTIAVFISSNTGLYGNIVERTFELFAREVKNAGFDVAVMGRLGLVLVESAGFTPPFTYFDFPDQRVDDVKLREIALYLVKYERVIVYYEQFQSLVRQEAIATDISGHLPPSKESQAGTLPAVKYLFEPTLPHVLEFFEKEVFSAILEQTIRDSQLAKFASRLVTLDSASENIKKRLKTIVFESVRLKHREKNKKQNQTFSSMSLWGR